MVVQDVVVSQSSHKANQPISDFRDHNFCRCNWVFDKFLQNHKSPLVTTTQNKIHNVSHKNVRYCNPVNVLNHTGTHAITRITEHTNFKITFQIKVKVLGEHSSTLEQSFRRLKYSQNYVVKDSQWVAYKDDQIRNKVSEKRIDNSKDHCFMKENH